MKFYHTINADGFVELVDTQQQSKAAGVKTPKPFEVPTDKDGLRDFVNNLYREIYPLEPRPEPSLAAQIVHEIDNPKRLEKTTLATEDVTDFILDCDSYHFSNVFAAFMERLDRFKREAAKLV